MVTLYKPEYAIKGKYYCNGVASIAVRELTHKGHRGLIVYGCYHQPTIHYGNIEDLFTKYATGVDDKVVEISKEDFEFRYNKAIETIKNYLQ